MKIDMNDKLFRQHFANALSKHSTFTGGARDAMMFIAGIRAAQEWLELKQVELYLRDLTGGDGTELTLPTVDDDRGV